MKVKFIGDSHLKIVELADSEREFTNCLFEKTLLFNLYNRSENIPLHLRNQTLKIHAANDIKNSNADFVILSNGCNELSNMTLGTVSENFEQARKFAIEIF